MNSYDYPEKSYITSMLSNPPLCLYLGGMVSSVGKDILSVFADRLRLWRDVRLPIDIGLSKRFSVRVLI